MKEKRLSQFEASLNARQENIEALCESRVKEKMEEFEKKVSMEVSQGTWKASQKTAPAGTGRSQEDSRVLASTGVGDVASGNTSSLALTPTQTTTATQTVSDSATTTGGNDDNALAPIVNVDMTNILKTLLLFLRQPQGDKGRSPGASNTDTRIEASVDVGCEKGVSVQSNPPGAEKHKDKQHESADCRLKFPHIGGGRSDGHQSSPNTRPSSRFMTDCIDSLSPVSRPNSKGVRSRKGSAAGYAHATLDDDVMSINLDNYDSNRRPTTISKDPEKLRQYDLKSGLGDIWVPPPSALARKVLPKTIVIFPLHTFDRGTSTDDLNPPPSRLDAEGTASISVDVESRNEELPPCRSPTVFNVETLSQSSHRVPVADLALETIRRELTSSTNPLSTLYHHFFPYLSVLSRHHLMAAASGVTCNRSADVDIDAATAGVAPTFSTKELADLFEVVCEEVSKLEYTSFQAMGALDLCEQDVNNLIIMASARQELDDSFYVGLKEASRFVYIM